MAVLGRWSGGSATHPTESWVSPNGLGTTQDRNDSSAYAWSSTSARLTLPSTGLADGYLVIARLHYTITHNNRHTHNARFTTNSGTGNFLSSTTGGYSRNNNNDENFVTTWAVVDSPSASYSLDYEWKRDQGDGTTAGSVTSFILDVIPLYYADIGLYSSTSTSLLGGTTPNTLPLTSTVVEGTNITRSGNVISVTGDNKRYLVLGSNYTEGRGGRTQRWVGAEYDGVQDRAAMACIYHRDTGTDENGIAFADLIETATATRTIEQFVYRGDGVAFPQGGASVDGSTPSVGAHAMAVIELNDSAEVFRSSNASASAQALNQGEATNVDLSAVNSVDFNDSASFTSASSTAVNAESTFDGLFGANVGGAYASNSTVRYTGRARFTVNGTEDNQTLHGNYGRGDQGSADTFGYSANPLAFVAVSSGDDVGVSHTELGDSAPVSAQPGWVGFWGVNLDTLEATGGTDALLADDTESSTELTSPVIGQEHGLTATSVESSSETTTPSVGQEHSLAAVSVQSVTELTSPAVTSASTVDNLLADDVSSASELDAPSIGQEHNLTATSAEAASEITSPAIGQENALLATSIEAASEITSPSIGQGHDLSGASVESATEITAPSISQQHALFASSVESAAELSTPVAAISATDILLADSVESATALSAPSLGQQHALLADDIEAQSEAGFLMAIAVNETKTWRNSWGRTW